MDELNRDSPPEARHHVGRRHRFRLEDLGQHLRRGEAAQLGIRLEDQAVGQDRQGQRLDVVRGDEVASLECRPGLRRSKQTKRPPRACPQTDIGVGAGAMRDARDVLLQLLVDIDRLNRFLAGQQLVGRRDRLELVDGRRELQTVETATQRASERLRQHRLAHPVHVFDQDVAAAQQRNHTQFDLRGFADEYMADVFHDPRTERLDRSVLHLHPLTSFSMIRFHCRVVSVAAQTLCRVYSLPRYPALPRRTRPALSPPIVPPLRTSTSSMTRPSVSRPADPSGPTGPMAPASSATTMKPTATMTPFQVEPPTGPIMPARNPPASNAPKVSSPCETSWPR